MTYLSNKMNQTRKKGLIDKTNFDLGKKEINESAKLAFSQKRI